MRRKELTIEELEAIIRKTSSSNATRLDLSCLKLTAIPESIGSLINLTELDLSNNRLSHIPESIGSLINLTKLDLGNNKLRSIPGNISNLINLAQLTLAENQLSRFPDSITNLHNLNTINLYDNPLGDSSIFQYLSQLYIVDGFLGWDVRRRYWKKSSEYKAEWLLDEENAEIRRFIIQSLGYEEICQKLETIELDTWREYTLLKIDTAVDIEPMLLLKMTCPSTRHIHILRVPPDMTSAELVITWVNHCIHPDRFAVQT